MLHMQPPVISRHTDPDTMVATHSRDPTTEKRLATMTEANSEIGRAHHDRKGEPGRWQIQEEVSEICLGIMRSSRTKLGSSGLGWLRQTER
jgi:hypothetical protein